jgi:hypothetical protein
MGTNRLRSSGSIVVRSTHGARALDEESRRFNLDEYRQRNGADAFAKSLRSEDYPEGGGSFGANQAYGARAKFGVSTDESTLTWGNQETFNFVAPAGGHAPAVSLPTKQLIHVARHRPTSFNILTVVTFGMGWTGESDWTVQLLFTIGVGQAQATFSILLDEATPANGNQLVDTRQYPANAIQTQCVLFGAAPAVAGQHTITIAQFCAPVFE